MDFEEYTLKEKKITVGGAKKFDFVKCFCLLNAKKLIYKNSNVYKKCYITLKKISNVVNNLVNSDTKINVCKIVFNHRVRTQ